MLRKALLSFVALLAIAVVSTGPAWAQSNTEQLFYTLDGTVSGSHTAYSSEGTSVQDNVTWMVEANIQTTPWRIGGKELSEVDRVIYCTDTLKETITRVNLDFGNAELITVNSITMIVASDADFNNVIDTKNISFSSNSNVNVTPSNNATWAKAFYKFVFNLTVTSSSNKYLQLNSIKFYYEPSTPAAQDVALTLQSNNNVMGSAQMVLHPENELFDEFTPASSSGSGIKTLYFNYNVDATNDAWINISSDYGTIEIMYNWNYTPQVTLHHVKVYNANGQSAEMPCDNGSYSILYFMNGNVYKDEQGNELLLTGGITKIEAYGIQMMLPDGVTATATPNIYSIVPGTQVPVAAVASRHYQLSNWSNDATTDTVIITVNEAMTLTANFVAKPVLTLASNDAQMGTAEVVRHEDIGFLFEVKAADYVGQDNHEARKIDFFLFDLPFVEENSSVWTNNSEDCDRLSVMLSSVDPQQSSQYRADIIGPNGERYVHNFGEAYYDVTLCLKNGNTFLSNYGSAGDSLWEGGVARIEIYGPGKVLPKGIDEITPTTYSVASGTVVPIQAKAKLRYHFQNWSNNSTDAQTSFTMPATAASLTATFAANPTLTLTATPNTGGNFRFVFDNTPKEITVNDGTATEIMIPISITHLDSRGTRGQFIIPAEQLSQITGATLNSVTFYRNNSTNWTSESQVNVYLKEVENTILSEYVDPTSATTVYTGTLTSNNGFVTFTFSEPYTYQGGNLLVGIDNLTEGNWESGQYYGVIAPSGSSAGSNYDFEPISFLPKSTFNYTPTLPTGVLANNDGTYSVASGTELTLVATANDGYYVAGWDPINKAVTNYQSDTATVTMSDSDRTLTVTFAQNPLLTLASNNSEWGSVSLEGSNNTIDTIYSNTIASQELFNQMTVVDNNGKCNNRGEWIYYFGAQYKYCSEKAADDWLITPAIAMEAGKTYTVTVDGRCADNDYLERFEVKAAAEATAEALSAGVQVIASTDVNNTEFTQYTGTFTPTADGNYRIGIHAISDMNMFQLFVRNLSITAVIPTVAQINDTTYRINYGTKVTVSATSSEPHHVKGWENESQAAMDTATYSDYAITTPSNLFPTTSTLTFTMTGDTTARALFSLNYYRMTFVAANNYSIEGGQATVAVDGQPATVTDSAISQVFAGQRVTLVAARGYKFRTATADPPSKTINIGNIVITYSEGDTWATIVEKNPDLYIDGNNWIWSLSENAVLSIDDHDVNPADIIDTSKQYWWNH